MKCFSGSTYRSHAIDCDIDPPKQAGRRCLVEGCLGLPYGGERCHESKSCSEILPHLTPGQLFMLGQSAVSKIIYVRPASGPENTPNSGENPT